jgi:hypothetical protein
VRYQLPGVLSTICRYPLGASPKNGAERAVIDLVTTVII